MRNSLKIVFNNSEVNFSNCLVYSMEFGEEKIKQNQFLQIRASGACPPVLVTVRTGHVALKRACCPPLSPLNSLSSHFFHLDVHEPLSGQDPGRGLLDLVFFFPCYKIHTVLHFSGACFIITAWISFHLKQMVPRPGAGAAVLSGGISCKNR